MWAVTGVNSLLAIATMPRSGSPVVPKKRSRPALGTFIKSCPAIESGFASRPFKKRTFARSNRSPIWFSCSPSSSRNKYGRRMSSSDFGWDHIEYRRAGLHHACRRRTDLKPDRFPIDNSPLQRDRPFSQEKGAFGKCFVWNRWKDQKETGNNQKNSFFPRLFTGVILLSSNFFVKNLNPLSSLIYF